MGTPTTDRLPFRPIWVKGLAKSRGQQALRSRKDPQKQKSFNQEKPRAPQGPTKGHKEQTRKNNTKTKQDKKNNNNSKKKQKKKKIKKNTKNNSNDNHKKKTEE